MTFTPPSPFTAAQASRAIKTPVPAELGSAQWRGLGAQVIERSLMSARVVDAGFLQQFGDLVDTILNPQRVTRPDGTVATEGMDYATARLRLKEYQQFTGYRPAEGEAGTIKDLSSDGRLNLILRTNAETAYGYGHFAQGQDPAILDLWPAQELFRAESRDLERDWPARWREAAAAASDGNAARVLEEAGRMIALKDSGIWEQLGNIWDDSLGNPYPPFAFRSGMWVRDIRRDQAMQLGLIDRDSQVDPQSRDFNEDLELTPEVRDQNLLSSILSLAGEHWNFIDGILKWKG